ncbi:hypothetical protein Btru_067878 [Bulinus truncatus]|nr:hypothetical protein Btru_067878 [Bulinus truncatus]
MNLLKLICTVPLLALVCAAGVMNGGPTNGHPTSSERFDQRDAPDKKPPSISFSKLLGGKLAKRFLDNIVKDIADTAKNIGEEASMDKPCSEKASLCAKKMEDVEGSDPKDPSVVCKKYAEVISCQKEVYEKCPELEKPAVEVLMKSFEETNKGSCDQVPKGAIPVLEPTDSDEDPCSLINRAMCTEKHSSAMQANSLTCQNVTDIKQCYMDLKPKCKDAEKGVEIDNELKNYEVLTTTCTGVNQESKPEGSGSSSNCYWSGLVLWVSVVIMYFTE